MGKSCGKKSPKENKIFRIIYGGKLVGVIALDCGRMVDRREQKDIKICNSLVDNSSV